MSARRFFALVAAAIVVIAVALSVGRRHEPPAERPGTALLPGFAARTDQLVRIAIRRGPAGPGVTLQRKDGRWIVAERAGYPADAARVRRLLQGLSDARIIEEKTADPANYPTLGVEDPQGPGAAGTELTLATAGATQVVLVGKPAMGGSFVRLGGEARALLAGPAIAIDAEPRDWIDPRIVALKTADIRDARRQPPRGPAVAVPASDLAVLASLEALDVAPAAGTDLRGATVTTVTLADGAILTLTGVAAGDRHWLTLSSSTDQALNDRTRGLAFDVAASAFDALFGPPAPRP